MYGPDRARALVHARRPGATASLAALGFGLAGGRATKSKSVSPLDVLVHVGQELLELHLHRLLCFDLLWGTAAPHRVCEFELNLQPQHLSTCRGNAL